MADGGYYFSEGHHHVIVRGMAGTIGGRPPLFERFSLGDTHTLRGWNKFDVAPLGGTRMAHASAGYRYRVIGVFYDVGSVWDHNETADAKHSVGVTVASREGPYLSVAFPLRGGAFVPVFMMGMNF
jgi:outer membrane protein assembly factor BamA